MSPAICLNLDQSKILLSGNGLTLYHTHKKSWTYQNSMEENVRVTKLVRFVSERVENIVGKEEKAGYQHYLLSQQCFQNPFFLWVIQTQECIVRVEAL